jgi:hypothetical protein
MYSYPQRGLWWGVQRCQDRETARVCYVYCYVVMTTTAWHVSAQIMIFSRLLAFA